MAEGRSRFIWGPASDILALIANVHRDPKKPQLTPAIFNPHLREQKKASAMPNAKISDYKDTIIKAGRLKVRVIPAGTTSAREPLSPSR